MRTHDLIACLALMLGACGGGYAPPAEQPAHFEAAVARARESLALQLPGDGDELRTLRRSALDEAERVDPQTLQRLHVAMPRHFHGELVRGLRLWVEGAKKDDADLLHAGDQAVPLERRVMSPMPARPSETGRSSF